MSDVVLLRLRRVFMLEGSFFRHLSRRGRLTPPAAAVSRIYGSDCLVDPITRRISEFRGADATTYPPLRNSTRAFRHWQTAECDDPTIIVQVRK